MTTSNRIEADILFTMHQPLKDPLSCMESPEMDIPASHGAKIPRLLGILGNEDGGYE